MNLYYSAVLLGLALCAMGFGIFISLRIFNIPDITTDGSYTLGAAITAAMVTSGYSIPVVLPVVLAGGALCGIATGAIHTRLNMQPLLAGILVMTALYSVNLNIMGRSNIPLIQTASLAGYFSFLDTASDRWLMVLLIAVGSLGGFIAWLLKTDFGLAMRATGNNENMIRALGVNTGNMKTSGLAIANACTAFSGFLVCQFQLFSDINMGIGIVIFGLGSVMMGEALMSVFRLTNIFMRLLGVVIGCVAFRIIIAAALSIGIDPNWLRLVTALIVLAVVGIPTLIKSR